MFRFVVLGLLCDGIPRHGYALCKEYRRRSGLHMNTGSFYRELQRLTAEGLVRPVENPPDADGRRVPYLATAAGKAAFEAWLAATRDAWAPDYEDALTARALFLGGSDASVLHRVLERWEEALWTLVKALEREREALLLRPSSDEGAYSPLSLLLARRLRHLSVELDFIDEYRSASVPRGTVAPEATASGERASAGAAAGRGPRTEPAGAIRGREPAREPGPAASAALKVRR